MCFHNSLSKKAQEVASRYKAAFKEHASFEPIFHGNGFNFPKWAVITNDKADTIQLFNWGLVPKWAKSMDDAAKIRTMTLNARSETAFEKPSFRESVKTNRCIIPSTGFFEWQNINKKKFPYFIYPKNGDFFSLAGIWEEWSDKSTGEIIKTFSILTTEANPMMAAIHNEKKRMPVIIPESLEKDWLSANISKEDFPNWTAPFDENEMTAHTISKLITSRTENSNVPNLHLKFDYPELVFNNPS